MDEPFIIHVGFPKTATSYLQRKVFPEFHRQKLINFIPFNDVRQTRDYILGSDGISYSPEKVKELLTPFIVSNRSNLISCEAFVGPIFYKSINNFDIARKLRLAFKNARILISIRNQQSLIYSLYKQYIHEGGHLTLRKFLNIKNGGFESSFRINDHRFNLNSLRFDRFIETYQEKFGKQNVTVLYFEEFIKDANCFAANIVEHTLQTKLKEPVNLEATVENPGFGGNQIWFSRWLSPLIRSGFNRTGIFPVNMRLRLALQSRWSFRLLGRKMKKDELVDQLIGHHFRSSNQRLFETIVQCEDGDLKALYVDE